MGCSPGDGDCYGDEKPAHSVTVASFEMLETEVTEGQYEAVTGNNPSCNSGGADSPVECVTWFDAQAFCEGIGARLPTEAEWEYAARGGTTTKYYCGDSSSCLDGIAWHDSNSGDHKHDVKGKDPNGYGLYDMTGNVWEWVEDCWHDGYSGAPSVGYPAWDTGCSGSARVHRGGGFDDGDGGLRVSYRGGGSPSDGYDDLGLRCARSE
jgi:formylglycine-generating enzyme required for sulfatase activity